MHSEREYLRLCVYWPRANAQWFCDYFAIAIRSRFVTFFFRLFHRLPVFAHNCVDQLLPSIEYGNQLLTFRVSSWCIWSMFGSFVRSDKPSECTATHTHSHSRAQNDKMFTFKFRSIVSSQYSSTATAATVIPLTVERLDLPCELCAIRRRFATHTALRVSRMSTTDEKEKK